MKTERIKMGKSSPVPAERRGRASVEIVMERLLPQDATLTSGQPTDWVLDALAHPDRYPLSRGDRDTEMGQLVCQAALGMRFWKEDDEAEELTGSGYDLRLEDRPDLMEHHVDLGAVARGVVR